MKEPYWAVKKKGVYVAIWKERPSTLDRDYDEYWRELVPVWIEPRAMEKEKVCPHCGERFQTKLPQKKFCRWQCQAAAQNVKRVLS